ncbi:conserved hypothetical protein [Candidatus Roizmanbacteria bacterium]|nr:conserved hypothetical protein [Candidatus Roizmanbacteria bacterium]
MKKTKNKINLIQTIFAVGFFVTALSIGYYFVIYIPQRDRRTENKEKIVRLLLDSCLNDTKSKFNNSLTNNISSATLEIVLKFYSQMKEECFRKFPIK